MNQQYTMDLYQSLKHKSKKHAIDGYMTSKHNHRNLIALDENSKSPNDKDKSKTIINSPVGRISNALHQSSIGSITDKDTNILPSIDHIKTMNFKEIYLLKKKEKHPAHKPLSKWDYIHSEDFKIKQDQADQKSRIAQNKRVSNHNDLIEQIKQNNRDKQQVEDFMKKQE